MDVSSHRRLGLDPTFHCGRLKRPAVLVDRALGTRVRRVPEFTIIFLDARIGTQSNLPQSVAQHFIWNYREYDQLISILSHIPVLSQQASYLSWQSDDGPGHGPSLGSSDRWHVAVPKDGVARFESVLPGDSEPSRIKHAGSTWLGVPECGGGNRL